VSFTPFDPLSFKNTRILKQVVIDTVTEASGHFCLFDELAREHGNFFASLINTKGLTAPICHKWATMMWDIAEMGEDHIVLGAEVEPDSAGMRKMQRELAKIWKRAFPENRRV